MKRGRRRLQVDEACIRELAARGLTAEQIAAAIAIDTGVVVSRATVQRRLAEARFYRHRTGERLS